MVFMVNAYTVNIIHHNCYKVRFVDFLLWDISFHNHYRILLQFGFFPYRHTGRNCPLRLKFTYKNRFSKKMVCWQRFYSKISKVPNFIIFATGLIEGDKEQSFISLEAVIKVCQAVVWGHPFVCYSFLRRPLVYRASKVNDRPAPSCQDATNSCHASRLTRTSI